MSASDAVFIPACIVEYSSGTCKTVPKAKDSNNIVSSFFISPPICMYPVEFRAFLVSK